MGPHSPQVVDAQRAEERIRAYGLRLLAWPLRRIGEEMGCSHEKVRQLINEEIESRVLPLADQYRQETIDRIDLAILKLMEEIAAGVRVARNAEVLGKLEERKAKMLGADAPVVSEVTAVVEHKPTEVLSLIEQAKQRVAEDEAVLREGRQQEEAAAREEHGPA